MAPVVVSAESAGRGGRSICPPSARPDCAASALAEAWMNKAVSSRLNHIPSANEGGQRLDAAAASLASKSRPKWLRLNEGAVGKLRILEHGRDARLLTARKTSRSECLLGAAL